MTRANSPREKAQGDVRVGDSLRRWPRTPRRQCVRNEKSPPRRAPGARRGPRITRTHRGTGRASHTTVEEKSPRSARAPNFDVVPALSASAKVMWPDGLDSYSADRTAPTRKRSKEGANPRVGHPSFKGSLFLLTDPCRPDQGRSQQETNHSGGVAATPWAPRYGLSGLRSLQPGRGNSLPLGSNLRLRRRTEPRSP